MKVLLSITAITACAIIAYYTYKMRQRNTSEYKEVENLKKRIDELDDENVETDSATRTGKIIVPDSVNPDESTKKSTQKEECKEYTVGPKQKMQKTVIGTNKEEKEFVNTEIERVEDEEAPIKENKSFVSKLLNNKKDEE